MKTTMDLSDALFEEAKALAKAQGSTLRALVENGLRIVIQQSAQTRAAPYVLPDMSVGGDGPAEYNPASWRDMEADWAVERYQRAMQHTSEQLAQLAQERALAESRPT